MNKKETNAPLLFLANTISIANINLVTAVSAQ